MLEPPTMTEPAGRMHFRMRRAAIVLSQRQSWVPLVTAMIVSLPILWLQLRGLGTAVFLGGLAYALTRAMAAAVSQRCAWHLIEGPGPPLEPLVLPVQIQPPELRSSYELILHAHECVRLRLAADARLLGRLKPLYDYCGELVQSAGRIASIANDVDAYLQEVDANDIARDRDRLEVRARHARDVEAGRTLAAAATVRARQLDNHGQLRSLYERVQARLEIVLVSLENVRAMVVKLHALDGEQIALANGCLSEQIDLLREDQRIVEAAIVEAVS